MDIQEATERLRKEVEILNKAPVNVNKLRDVECAIQARETAIAAMQELQQYRQIGTIEQCREARQKQEPKKYKLINSVRCCPECDSPIKACYDFCKSCGQALKFTERKRSRETPGMKKK